MSKLYRDDVISVAQNEIGYMEKASDYDLDSKTGNAGHNNYTKPQSQQRGNLRYHLRGQHHLC